MGDMFYNCESLNKLNLGNKFNTQNVTYMRYMFYNCKSLSILNSSDNKLLNQFKKKKNSNFYKNLILYIIFLYKNIYKTYSKN